MFLISKFFILKSIFPFLAFLLAWELTWKGIALYKSGRKGEVRRFICVFIFNTCGILPIIYLLIDSTKDNTQGPKSDNKTATETKQTKKSTQKIETIGNNTKFAKTTRKNSQNKKS